ncbi:MAG: UDP-N-acetylmuramoyl-L-alanine--D-glutamate ligase [Saprospiraceae bacterium]|nr:UDP-N-acetylmuramoyl-L-alanine--D-glutamate ligase [Saprospiraceae bacterium]MBK7811266.1 UDP-N-acetylmuramoyl-L-alanine--D-glutamate ligase [Saprospiraceae bacterium]
MMVLILGAGESGIGAALLAKAQNMLAFVSEQKSIGFEIKEKLIELEIDFEENGHVIAFEALPDLAIVSPGIPSNSTIVRHLISRGVEIISEIEFASRFCKGKVIAITGSNGKTTTTNLCHHILNVNGNNVAKVGNVGYSFARSVSETVADYYVVELSSFQLDHINSFRPDIGILLNITPDHLDRYDYNFQNYVNAKFRIGEFQTNQDHLIVNIGDQVIQQNIGSIKNIAKTHSIEIQLDNEGFIWINGNRTLTLQNSVLKGNHNAVNIACVFTALKILGLSVDQIQSGLDSFVNDPHRMEVLGEFNGVEFINDSKATNVDSVYWALDAMQKPVIWIAGGQDKGNEYGVLQALVKTKVKALICMGLDNQKLLNAFNETTPIKDTHDINSAIQEAWNIAQSGDVILLSPACASFDLFKNYMDRGEQFKNEFEKLKESVRG